MLEPRILLSADLIPVAGEIEVPGETDFYTFELAEERTIVFDSLIERYDLTGSLEGVGGQIVGPTQLARSDADHGGEIIALDAGTYTLAIDGDGAAQGEYSFRLLNAANAQRIETDRLVSGSLETEGRETDLFQFDVTEGTELFFDARSFGNGSASWQLVDPDGQTVFGPTSFSPTSDVARFAAPKDGTYTLLLEGRITNGADSDYSFSISHVVDETRAIAVDDLVRGVIAQPGQRHDLTFTLASDTTVLFDSLTTVPLPVTLNGPRGPVFENRFMNRLDAGWSDGLLELIAGDYTLSIGGRDDSVGAYGFRMIATGDAEQIDLAEPATGTLSDQGVGVFGSRIASGAGVDDGGLAQLFTEATPHFSVPDADALRPETLTIETWIRPDEFDFFDQIAGKTTTGAFNDGYGLYMTDTGVAFYLNSWFNASSRVAADLELGVWSHVAATYDGAAIRIYVNGELREERDYSADINHSAGPLLIGSNPDGYKMKGALDELRLWSRALNADEVADQYDQRIGSAEGLELSLGFDATSPESAEDRSANGFEAMAVAGPALESRLFHFDAAGGETLVTQLTPTGISLSIFDPMGNRIFGPDNSPDEDITLPDTAGRYLLAVEAEPWNTQPLDFSLTLVPPSQETLELDFDTLIEGELSTVGEADSFSFSLDGQERVYIDAISTGRGDLTWQIFGPRGPETTARPFSASDAYNTQLGAILS
ncbi:LamG-like jellyroll fold domain-containing protein, partial [Cribrihabitans sp. XS_ASV171]